MDLRSMADAGKRREFLKNEFGAKLQYIEKALIDDERNVRVENLIGATSVPLGIAGPLKVQNSKPSTKGRQNYYIPLATTEGALVASVNRGCRAIALSGGVNVNSHKVGTTRGPVFYTGSIKKGNEFYHWLKENESFLRRVAEGTSKHLKFKKLDVKMVATYSFVRFYFDTSDAMGMNMATIATQKMAEFIEKETGIECLSVAGNFDNDKKPAWINFINNRGFKVWAEAVVPESIVKSLLKTTSKNIFDVWLAKCMIGSAISGSLGFNAHYANIVAALYAATGQDLAHAVEGSMGITTVQVLEKNDLYFSVYLPSVMVGTVGGGTKYRTQTEALEIIGIKHSNELAEVLGGAVLAGELSLLASLAEGSLASAHEKLGR